MVDVWTFLGSGIGYYKVDADTMVRSSLFAYPSGSQSVDRGRRPFADDDYVYASAAPSDVVFRVDIATDAFTRTTVGDFPVMMADDGTTLWVANQNDNDVSRVDKATMVRGTDEAIVNSGTVLWVDPYLWVFEAGAGSASFRVYDPVTDSIVKTETLAVGSADINDAVYYDDHVYVPVRFIDELYKIDALTYSVVSSVPFTEGFRIVEVNDYLYVATTSAGSQDITKIDPSDLSTVATLVGTYSQLTHNYVDTLWSMTGTSLAKIDLNTFTQTTTTLIGAIPTGIVYGAGPPVPPPPIVPSNWVVGAVGW